MSDSLNEPMDVQQDERFNISIEQHIHIGVEVPGSDVIDDIPIQSRSTGEQCPQSQSFATSSFSASSVTSRTSKFFFSYLYFVIKLSELLFIYPFAGKFL